MDQQTPVNPVPRAGALDGERSAAAVGTGLYHMKVGTVALVPSPGPTTHLSFGATP